MSEESCGECGPFLCLCFHSWSAVVCSSGVADLRANLGSVVSLGERLVVGVLGCFLRFESIYLVGFEISFPFVP
jgi:hypothetical protein